MRTGYTHIHTPHPLHSTAIIAQIQWRKRSTYKKGCILCIICMHAFLLTICILIYDEWVKNVKERWKRVGGRKEEDITKLYEIRKSKENRRVREEKAREAERKNALSEFTHKCSLRYAQSLFLQTRNFLYHPSLGPRGN